MKQGQNKGKKKGQIKENKDNKREKEGLKQLLIISFVCLFV